MGVIYAILRNAIPCENQGRTMKLASTLVKSIEPSAFSWTGALLAQGEPARRVWLSRSTFANEPLRMRSSSSPTCVPTR